MTTETTTISALSEYDFIVAIDASGSMTTEDMPNGQSRWRYMQETASAFCRDIQKLDGDGIGVVVFSGVNVESYDNVTAETVAEIFKNRNPRGSTPLAEGLKAALKLAGKSDKKDFIIVFTDGAPDDKDAAAKVIRDASNLLASDDALTILFIQVGREADAAAWLRTLDDDLKGAKRDIVDAKTMEEAERFSTTAELIAHAIND